MSRRRQRQEAMMLAYEMQANKEEELAYLSNYFEKHEKDLEENEYCYTVLKNMLVNVAPIVKAIQLGSAKWKIERISKMDLSILKIAITELFFIDDVPAKVSINEAIELSKKYSGEVSYKYVNGVLRNVNDNIENYADKETSYLDKLMEEVEKDVKEENDEKARLEEIALIEKRLEQIRAAKAEALKVKEKKASEDEALKDETSKDETSEDETSEDEDEIVFLDMND